ncbi:hypothetical protein BJX62DRAFT_233953 [Aspergillus germanicus]
MPGDHRPERGNSHRDLGSSGSNFAIGSDLKHAEKAPENVERDQVEPGLSRGIDMTGYADDPGRDTVKARLYGGETVCLNMLLANRQIYYQARKIPYSSDRFAFSGPTVFKGFIANWFHHPRLDSCMRLIRTIVIYVALCAEATIDDWEPIPSLQRKRGDYPFDSLQEVRIVIGRRSRNTAALRSRGLESDKTPFSLWDGATDDKEQKVHDHGREDPA